MRVLLSVLILGNICLILFILMRPVRGRSLAGKILTFMAMFVIPIMVMAGGLSYQLETSKTTRFCLSCHVMEPYGESLHIDDQDHVPAAHFQNRRIDRESACFTCHTTYALFGDFKAKMTGVKHVWVNYLGTIPEKLELYEPFQNRECLHCHSGARSYEENELHADILQDLASNKVSCLDCHDVIHDIEHLASLERWQEHEE